MPMRVHELHPAVIHLPLLSLPGAAVVDLAAVISKNPKQATAGKVLWWSVVGSGLFAGLAGMAASQEVKAEEKHVKDMMWLHGMGNFTLVLSALGVAAWRARHAPSMTTTILGLVASGAATYTAYLGGEMVYTHGVGVKALPATAPAGVKPDLPALWSNNGITTLARDAVKGLGWLLSRARGVVTGGEPVTRRALLATECPSSLGEASATAH